jgi:hypothetical protein
VIASRRRFLSFVPPALVATPAIVRVAANLMPVSTRFCGLHEMERFADALKRRIDLFEIIDMNKAIRDYAKLCEFPLAALAEEA